VTDPSTAPPAGRKRRGEGHTRREEILQAAKELFLEQGYEQTTMRRIADRVGISAPAVYLYFKDKEALMLALCDQTFAHLIEAVSDLERTVSDPLERVRRFGQAYARFGLDHPDEYRLIFLGTNTPEAIRQAGHRAPVEELAQPGMGGALVFQRLVSFLVEVEASGVKLNYPPDTCAELCWMGVHGLVSALILKPDFPWSDRDLLLKGMLDIHIRGMVKAS
jgi:AcrR family transcriptional regulator